MSYVLTAIKKAIMLVATSNLQKTRLVLASFVPMTNGSKDVVKVSYINYLIWFLEK